MYNTVFPNEQKSCVNFSRDHCQKKDNNCTSTHMGKKRLSLEVRPKHKKYYVWKTGFQIRMVKGTH